MWHRIAEADVIHFHLLDPRLLANCDLNQMAGSLQRRWYCAAAIGSRTAFTLRLGRLTQDRDCALREEHIEMECEHNASS